MNRQDVGWLSPAIWTVSFRLDFNAPFVSPSTNYVVNIFLKCILQSSLFSSLWYLWTITPEMWHDFLRNIFHWNRWEIHTYMLAGMNQRRKLARPSKEQDLVKGHFQPRPLCVVCMLFPLRLLATLNSLWVRTVGLAPCPECTRLHPKQAGMGSSTPMRVQDKQW